MRAINIDRPAAGPPSARHRGGWPWLALAAGLTLAACATAPPPTGKRVAAPAAPPEVRVYFYPAKGQSAAQQDRDRYECYRWAVKQTGFDPSLPALAPRQRVYVTPTRAPGEGAAVGAVTGAAVGAVISRPGHAAEGAMAGAVAGAVIGAAADAEAAAQAERAQQQLDQREAQRAARLEQQAASYRRAMGACLEGRGYTVR